MSKTSKDRGPPKGVAKLIGEFHRHHGYQVFSDFVEVGAISLSNAVDLAQREKRETCYMEIVKRYQPEEVQKFPEMFAALTLTLEEGFADVLGAVFHELELHNKWTGQFFSPYNLCQTMANMTLEGTEAGAIINERGFVTAWEPCVGSGAMAIALAEALKKAGINYQQHLHVTAVDVDPKCVHMAYVQFSLLHIPAVIVHGNTVTRETWSHWYTPAHIIGGWNGKLRRGEGDSKTVEPAPESAEPPALPTNPPSQLTLF